MTRLSLHRPGLVLTIGTRTLSLGQTEAGWPGGGGARRRRWCDRPAPAGLIRISASAPNLADPSALAAELRGLRRALPGNGPALEAVALTLPDLCGRVVLLDFGTLPAQPDARRALVGWRLRDSVHWPDAPTRLVYRTFRRTDAPGGGGGLRVLAVSILESVLAEYERACREAGLLPVSVGLNSLQLFDRCRPVMDRAEGRMGEQLFLAVNEDSVGFVAIRDRCPVMVRLKPWRPDEQTGPLPDDLVATMQFYTEIVPELLGPAARPLFAVEAAAWSGDSGRPLTVERLLPPAALQALGIHLIPLGRDGRLLPRPAMPPASWPGLPAMAAP